jgi:hypothetical protein
MEPLVVLPMGTQSTHMGKGYTGSLLYILSSMVEPVQLIIYDKIGGALPILLLLLLSHAACLAGMSNGIDVM